MVICLERGADLHMAQLMPLPLTVSCSSKIQIGFTFLVPAHLGSPGQSAVKRVCVIPVVRCTSSARAPPRTSARGIRIVSAQRTTEVHETSHYRGPATASCTVLYGLYLPTVILTVLWYSITHSLFLSWLKTFLLCKSFQLQPFLPFYLNIYYMDFPDCLLLFLGISVFYF